MRSHTRRPRARSATLRPSVTRAACRSLDDGVGVGGCRVGQDERSDLAIDVRQDLPRPLVSVAGDLDLASVGLLTAMLHHVRRSLPPPGGAVFALDQVDVDVDLTAVTFADSHGLAPLLDSGTRIVAASTAVRRLLLLLRHLPLAPPPLPPGEQDGGQARRGLSRGPRLHMPPAVCLSAQASTAALAGLRCPPVRLAKKERVVKIQMNSAKDVELDSSLARLIEQKLTSVLDRYSDQITRIEVHLGDEIAGRSDGRDKRCTLEARPAGQPPVTVTDWAGTSEQAIGGALKKLLSLLESRTGRADSRKGGQTIRHLDVREGLS